MGSMTTDPSLLILGTLPVLRVFPDVTHTAGHAPTVLSLPTPSNQTKWACLCSTALLHTFHHQHHHLSLNLEGRWDTTDDFTTSFLHFSLSSTALWDLANSRPVHSLKLTSHLFLCLSCLLFPFTVPCKLVLARPDEQ